MSKLYSLFLKILCIFFIFTDIGCARLEITWIDVGQGDASFSQFPVQPSRIPALIVDSGSSKNTSKRKTTIKTNIISVVNSFFSVDMSLEKTNPDLPDLYIVVTHGDEDHLYFLVDIVQELERRAGHELDIRFLLGGTKNDYCQNNKEGKKFFEYVEDRASQRVYRHGPFLVEDIVVDPASIQLQFSHNTHLDILAALKSTNKNENSIISRLVHGETSVVFTGDAPNETAEIALRHPKFTSPSTLLQLSHHGSSTHRSNAKELFQAVQSRYFVCSSGTTQYGHPHEGVFENFFQAEQDLLKEFYLVKFSTKGDIQLLDHPGSLIPIGTEGDYTYAALRMPFFSTIVQGNLSFIFDDTGVLEVSPSTISKLHTIPATFTLPLLQPLPTKTVLQRYITPLIENIVLNDFDFTILTEVKDNILNATSVKRLSMSGNQLGQTPEHVEFIKEIIMQHNASLEEVILTNNNFSEEEREEIKTAWGVSKTGLIFD